MSVLLIRLEGPMQAWGTQSKFRYRDTGLEPSKSGVIGLLCAALGRPRSAPLDDLCALRMGVRVDREGLMKLDFHTVGAGYIKGLLPALAPPVKAKAENGIISHRYYLADASFLVGLEGPRPLLTELNEALARPVWGLCLGRKAFPPGKPVCLPDEPPFGPGVRDDNIESLFKSYWPPDEFGAPRRGAPPARVRIVLDARGEQAAEAATDHSEAKGTETRTDVPISFAHRTFTSRSVRTYWQEIDQ